MWNCAFSACKPRDFQFSPWANHFQTEFIAVLFSQELWYDQFNIRFTCTYYSYIQKCFILKNVEKQLYRKFKLEPESVFNLTNYSWCLVPVLRPVLHHYVAIIFIWDNGLYFVWIWKWRSAHTLGASRKWHLSLLLPIKPSLFYPHAHYASLGLPLSQINTILKCFKMKCYYYIILKKLIFALKWI